MTRIDLRPWAGVALFVAVLAYVGCSWTTTPDSSPAPSPSPSAAAAPGAVGGSAASGTQSDSSDGGEKLVSNLGEIGRAHV